jgi:hypothetical protein
VNGSDGIGTGWSSSIPTYNPLDIIQNIKHLIKDEVRLFNTRSSRHHASVASIKPSSSQPV